MRYVPMGYTELFVHEKRGVVVDGEPQRIWPARFAPIASNGPFHLIVPSQGEFSHLDLGGSHPFWAAISQAVNLSARLSQPVLVTRQLESRGWH